MNTNRGRRRRPVYEHKYLSIARFASSLSLRPLCRLREDEEELAEEANEKVMNETCQLSRASPEIAWLHSTK